MSQQQFDELMKLIDKYGDDCEAFGDYQTSSNGVAVKHSRNKIIKYIKENIMIPMAETKNALAELAEDLEEIVRDTKSDFYTTAISKAQRIVAELAKVEDRRDEETNSDAIWRWNDCIAKCRAIAEKGCSK